jgi:VRR-NUC domain
VTAVATGGRAPRLASALSEAQLQACVLDFARLTGWLATHSRPAAGRAGRWATPVQGEPGFPDLVLARRGRVVVVELKSQRGRLTGEQQLWLAELRAAAGVEVYVWRPSDWLDGTVRRVLDQGSERKGRTG